MSHVLQNPLTGETISNEKLQQVAALSKRQLELEQQVAAAELALKTLKEKLAAVQLQELPDAMLEIGLAYVELTTGDSVSIDKFYSGSIKDTKPQALVWLKKNNHDSIIKTNFVLPVGRDPVKTVKIQQILLKNKLDFILDENVHPQTLKAFIREMTEAGKPLAMDLLNVYIGNKSIVKKKA
jgi:hypothetical protein